MADYAHPESLVSTEWVAQHSKDPNVRVVEVDVDTNAYKEGHVPDAIAWAWNTQLCDTLRAVLALASVARRGGRFATVLTRAEPLR